MNDKAVQILDLVIKLMLISQSIGCLAAQNANYGPYLAEKWKLWDELNKLLKGL